MELNDFWHISTVNTWSPRENNNIYGKRWDIEVFFKLAKQHLKREIEIPAGPSLNPSLMINLWNSINFLIL